MRRIAVLTSGGDAPGMNAAVRAVVRAADDVGLEALGVRNGYTGLLAAEMAPLGSRDVSGIIQQGGTVLGTTRCADFRTDAGRQRALDILRRHGIDGLVVIGGGGSQTGAFELSRLGARVVGVASTIDNDLCGSDMTIGTDSALYVALEAIDRLKVTAAALRRAFLVEVMGRDCGYLALMAGIAGGAVAVCLPEEAVDPEAVATEVTAAYERGKRHALVVVAEGANPGTAALTRYFTENRERLGFEIRATILGHVQRGGTPTAFDRLLATRLGAAAVAEMAAGRDGVLVGLRGGDIVATPLAEVVGKRKPLDPALIVLARALAR